MRLPHWPALRKPAVPVSRDPLDLGGALARLGLVAVFFVALFEGMLRGGSREQALFALVLAAPFAIPVVVPAVLALIPAFFRFARDHTLIRWQGRYYEFEGRQIRVETLGCEIWIVWSDARLAAGLGDDAAPPLSAAHRNGTTNAPPEVRRLPETKALGVSDRLLLECLAQRRTQDAARFERWLLREVLPPLYRSLGRVPELELAQAKPHQPEPIGRAVGRSTPRSTPRSGPSR